MSACDEFSVDQPLLGGFVVLSVGNGKVTIGGPTIGGVPFAITFDCDQFWVGFYALLDLLGIPHP